MRIGEYSPEHLEDGSVAILVINHIGSTVAQDTGRDAQYLADAWNIPTFAINRPGTGRVMPRTTTREQLAANYANAFEPVANELANLLDRREINDIAVVGRSAAVVGALAIANTDILPIRAIYGAEGVGWTKMTVAQGKQTYTHYMREQAQLLDSDIRSSPPRLTHPESPGLGLFSSIGRLISIPPAGFVDQYNSQEVWASDLATKYLAALKGREDSYVYYDRPAIYLDFAEHSLTNSRTVNDLRQVNPEADIQIVPNTVHASFDKRSFFAKRSRRVLGPLIGVV